MTKKFFVAVLSLILSLFCLNIVVSANDIMPADLYTSSCSSTLKISGTTATCTSNATGYVGETTKIVMDQTLQKKTSSGLCSKVSSWSETDKGYKGSATNTISDLSKGTYRLKTVFTIYSGTNYETIEKISSEVTV